MSAIAVAERVVAVPLETAFARFIDFTSWDLFMPASFRPITGPARALRQGDRMRLALGPGAQIVSEATIVRVRPNKEICWSWGIPALVQAQHSFFFSEANGGTRVRSEEPASGLLTFGPLGRVFERELGRVGEEMLAGFAAHVAKPLKPLQPGDAPQTHERDLSRAERAGL